MHVKMFSKDTQVLKIDANKILLKKKMHLLMPLVFYLHNISLAYFYINLSTLPNEIMVIEFI